jgi:hypothetical protein
MNALSLTTEAKRHKARVALAAKIGAEPARVAIVNLLAATKGLIAAECFEEARRTLLPTLETLSIWAYCLIRGKCSAPRFDATTALQQLRQAGAIDKATWQWAYKALTSQDAKPQTVQGLYDLARKLYSLTGGYQAGNSEKAPRDFPEAFHQYRASCLDTPGNPSQTARLSPDAPARLPSGSPHPRKPDELEERPGDRLAESVRKELQRGDAAARRVPTLEDADRMFSQGQYVVAGIVAYASLLERLKDAAYVNECRPARESGVWERGYRPNQYGDSLLDAGIYSEKDAADVRKLGILGLNISTLVVTEATIIKAYVNDVRAFLASHPVDYRASGDPWGPDETDADTDADLVAAGGDDEW